MVEPDREAANRGHQVVESLLSKPSKKPNFASFQAPEILKRAQAFLPAFITNTDKILSNPEFRQTHQMDIKIKPADEFNPATQQADFERLQEGGVEQKSDSRVVNMDIGVGLFDVENEPKANEVSNQLPPGMGFHQTSTDPILRVQPHAKAKCAAHANDSDSDSEESSSGDEDRFMQFDSSEEEEMDDEEHMTDAQSLTTKGSAAGAMPKRTYKKVVRPLIQEISSKEFQPSEESKEPSQSSSAAGLKRKFKDFDV